MIPYGCQDIDDADISAVVEVLRSDWLTQGPKVPLFERLMAQRCGSTYSVAVNSATSALHIACQALGVGEGDVGWTVPITFVASANCLRYCGADVDFVDIDSRTLNIDVKALEAKLIAAKNLGRLPKVLIPVHFSGSSCDMKAIHQLSITYGFKVIEDASHAVGAMYEGKSVGGGQYSDMTIFSFHPVKLMTTGEGGMILGNDSELMGRVARLRSHGITREREFMESESDGAWYYQQLELGYNYRMTEMQAALGVSQLSRLDSFLIHRRLLAQRYDTLLARLPVIRPILDAGSAWHLYVIQLQEPNKRKVVFDFLRSEGIGVNVHYIPVHLQPYYQKLGHKKGTFPVSEEYYESAITLPLHARMTEAEQDFVVSQLSSILGYSYS